ncbi:MAG: DUF2851 family protein [Bacteroidales bacterium]|nr:DUF2851 family protein [Bacteroidales bacterium]
MTEAFLQYVWQHRLLDGPLTTVDGQPIVVERAGELNRDAGPDFFDARLVIGGIHWAGNVEVHVKASDWNAHHHSSDEAYNNVILHVVYVNDTDIVLQNGKRMPTLKIADAIPEYVWDNYDELISSRQPILCSNRLKDIPDFLFHLSQDRMIVERMQRKTDDVQRILKETHGSWEETCYILTARYFGGKTNAFPFELLAKITPMKLAAKIKDSPLRVEALYFGQAGLLEQEFADDFPRELKEKYDLVRIAHKLNPMPGHLWKFFRIRPPSFPTLRISQFANLVTRSSNLFSHLLETDDVKELYGLFDVRASDYWDTHYNFDKPVECSPKNFGKSLVNNILINAWVPLLCYYGMAHDNQKYKDRAFSLLQQLPPESNRIVRLWKDENIRPSNAAESQALIQRYNEYCSRQGCLDCQFAFRLIKTKK